MPKKNKKLHSSLKKFDKKKSDQLEILVGNLGIPLDGFKLVEVPNRLGFVYVRLRGNTSELIQAYNATVSPIYDLPVLVARQGNVYKILGHNVERYQNQWGVMPYLPKHGTQHSFNHAAGMGGDVAWIYSQQFMPLLAYPSGTYGSMTLSVEPAFYEWEGQWKYAQNTGTPSFAPYRPSTGAVMCLYYLDGDDNSLKITAGTPFSASLTGSAQLAQYIPDISRAEGIPIAGVRLVTGTTQIGWDAIYDLRDFYTVGGGSSTGSFVGLYGQDEGTLLGTGTTLNVTGDRLTLSLSGTVFNLKSSPDPQEIIGVYGLDDGVPKGTGTSLNVTGNLELTISGTVLNLSAPVTTYQRFERPIPTTNATGTLWRVPDNVYASGSLGVYYNGLALYKNADYEELIYISGTYQLLFTPSTGSTHMVSYGVPCAPQAHSPTGSVVSEFALQDSDSELLTDSDNVQLLDSDG